MLPAAGAGAILAGASQYDGADVDSLLGDADRALYSAKRSGRNRVCSAEQSRALTVG